MRCEHRIFEESGLAALILRGTVTAGVIVECVGRLYTDPLWDPAFQSIWDAREIRELVIRPRDVERLMTLSREVAARAGTGHRAIIVSASVVYDIAVLFGIREKPLGRETHVFWEPLEALRWLGIEPTSEIIEYLRVLNVA